MTACFEQVQQIYLNRRIYLNSQAHPYHAFGKIENFKET